MGAYNDTVLLNLDLNRIASISFDYYENNSYNTWVGYIFNDTTTEITDCKILTVSGIDEILYISGGGVTGYTLLTSDWDTAYSIGTIVSGGMEQIVLCVSGGVGLSGFQSIPIYISK